MFKWILEAVLFFLYECLTFRAIVKQVSDKMLHFCNTYDSVPQLSERKPGWEKRSNIIHHKPDWNSIANMSI